MWCDLDETGCVAAFYDDDYEDKPTSVVRADDTLYDLYLARPEHYKLDYATRSYVFEPNIVGLKAAKLKGVSTNAQLYVDGQVPAYPEFEKLTFETQRREAKAWESDNNTPTPNIDILANARGIDRVELLSRILIKVAQFDQLAMTVAGQRQKYEDQVNAATTVEEVNAIDPIYS